MGWFKELVERNPAHDIIIARQIGIAHDGQQPEWYDPQVKYWAWCCNKCCGGEQQRGEDASSWGFDHTWSFDACLMAAYAHVGEGCVMDYRIVDP